MCRKTVLISGAGIAGPTCAYWLARRGFTPVLIERAPRLRDGGYMIDFWGVGFDVAERMGLIPTLRDAGYSIDRVDFVAANGHVRSSLGAGAFARALGDRFLSIPRGDLASAIYRTIENDVETIFDDGVSDIRQDDGGLEVSFERGRPRRFDLLIGADGLHSRVRFLASLDNADSEKYLGYYAASFATDGYQWRNEHTYLSCAAPGLQISRYALRGDRTAFLMVFAAHEKLDLSAKSSDMRKQILKQRFGGEQWIEWPEIAVRLERASDVYFDAVSQISLHAWSRGRAALIGDAAYCPSLLSGEGTALAMGGAYLIAYELERAGGDFSAAFEAYERGFRPLIERKQQSARKFASSFAPRTRFGLFVRDLVLRLSSIKPVSEYLMRQFVEDRFELPS